MVALGSIFGSKRRPAPVDTSRWTWEPGVTDPKGRGVWGDATGAKGVLDALGGPSPASTPGRSPQPPVAAPRGPYRGRCGNLAHPAVYAGKGAARVLVEPESEGCPDEVAESREDRHNYLKLCEKCLVKYKAEDAIPREHVALTTTHVPMPDLCWHGQKEHQCQIRNPPCEFNGPAKPAAKA